MNNNIKDELWGIFVIYKKELFNTLKSIRLILLMIFFSLIIAGTVYGGISLMGVANNNPNIEFSEIILNQGPVFILSMTSGIVGIFGSLFALILSFDTIIREKVQNSINLLLCRPIGKRSIALGKFLGNTSALALPVIVVNTIAIIAISLYSEKGIEFTEAFGFILYTIIFLAIFCAIGQLLSSLLKTTVTAILSGIFIWLFFIMGIGIISYFLSDISTQISLLNPLTSYSICISDALGLLNPSDTDIIPLWGYYLTFVIWLIAPLILSIEIFNKVEN